MVPTISNRQMETLKGMSTKMWNDLDGDFKVFIVDCKIQEMFNAEGDVYQVATPFLYVEK